MAARDAAAMPFPREDTTPPVTKTSGVTEAGAIMGSGVRWKCAFYRLGGTTASARDEVLLPAQRVQGGAMGRSRGERSEGVPATDIFPSRAAHPSPGLACASLPLSPC